VTDDIDRGAGDPCPECGDVHGTCPHCDGQLNCNGLCDDCEAEQEADDE
jgi:hypothetical protein